jgi:hypothetical protein
MNKKYVVRLTSEKCQTPRSIADFELRIAD